MTSKRIKKKKKKTSKFVALLLLFKNREKENYIQKQTISKTHDDEFFLGGYLYKKREREREKQNEEMDDSFVISHVFLVRSEKKFRFHVKRKHNKQQAKRKKTTKQTDD